MNFSRKRFIVYCVNRNHKPASERAAVRMMEVRKEGRGRSFNGTVVSAKRRSSVIQ